MIIAFMKILYTFGKNISYVEIIKKDHGDN
jgi:hypothetical protein